MGLLRIEWVKSAIGYPRDQRATLRALGLRRRGASVVHRDSPAVRGAIQKVRHLVKVEEIDETA